MQPCRQAQTCDAEFHTGTNCGVVAHQQCSLLPQTVQCAGSSLQPAVEQSCQWDAPQSPPKTRHQPPNASRHDLPYPAATTCLANSASRDAQAHSRPAAVDNQNNLQPKPRPTPKVARLKYRGAVWNSVSTCHVTRCRTCKRWQSACPVQHKACCVSV